MHGHTQAIALILPQRFNADPHTGRERHSNPSLRAQTDSSQLSLSLSPALSICLLPLSLSLPCSLYLSLAPPRSLSRSLSLNPYTLILPSPSFTHNLCLDVFHNFIFSLSVLLIFFCVGPFLTLSRSRLSLAHSSDWLWARPGLNSTSVT